MIHPVGQAGYRGKYLIELLDDGSQFSGAVLLLQEVENAVFLAVAAVAMLWLQDDIAMADPLPDHGSKILHGAPETMGKGNHGEGAWTVFGIGDGDR